MKKNILLTVLCILVMLLFTSCSKKEVEPPALNNSEMELQGEGNEIYYPPADGTTSYNESAIGAEETLDSTNSYNNDTGNLSVNSDSEAIKETDAYKKEHGRSSPGFSPIYYDFDNATIRADMIYRMKNNAIFLNENPSTNVVIEGNCDYRGTNEYNLALGQRRALVAKQYLIDLGIDSNRIRTVSYGEENPLFIGNDEEAYAQNRRCDFVAE